MFLRSISRLVFLLVAVDSMAASASDPWLHLDGGSGQGNGQHIVFVTGEEFYRSEEGMSMFAKILAQRHGYDCTVLFAIDPADGYINPNQSRHLPGLQNLADADLMVVFARFRELSDPDMKHIVDFVNAGKPVIGIRNATHAFKYAKDSDSAYTTWAFNSKDWMGGFGQQILGDTWVSHHGHFQKESTTASIEPASRNHPVLRGVADDIFIRTDVNGVNKLTADDTVLLRGRVLAGTDPNDLPVTDGRNQTPMPLAWMKTYTAPSGAQGRAFCTTAGSSTDWLSEDLRRLVVNAVLALTGHEDAIPAKINVDFVGDYTPTPFGAKTDDQWASEKLTPASFGQQSSR